MFEGHRGYVFHAILPSFGGGLKTESLHKEILEKCGLCIDNILFNNNVILIRLVMVNVSLLWL